MIGLTPKAAEILKDIIEGKFNAIALNFLGLIPKAGQDKRLILDTNKNSLVGLFLQSLGSKNPNKSEEDVLKTMLITANNYMDALKNQTIAKALNSVDAYIKDTSSIGTGIKLNRIKDIIQEELKIAQKPLSVIVGAESNKCVNTATALQIAKIAEEKGKNDPTVFFSVIIDERTGDEEKVLHLLPDGKTPRVWSLSEIGASYHKRGDKYPKLGGLHNNCRCLTDKYAPVITEQGTKPLCKVKIGDRVLTHTGKFKRVVGTYGENGLPFDREFLYRVEFKDPKGKIRKLRMTPDHLMLTDNGWTRADELTVEHSLKWLVKKCEYCGIEMPHDIEKDNKRFCSPRCVGLSRIGLPGPALGRKQSKETIEKRAIGTKISAYKKAINSGKISTIKSTCIVCRQDFSKESDFSSVLSDIRRVSMNSNEEYGFKNAEIINVVKIYKTKVSSKARIFDLTVEDDESFVIMGVVSHNCRLSVLMPGWSFDSSGHIKYKSKNWDELKYQREKFGLPR